VNLIVERPEEGDVVAASWIGDARRDAACDVCGFARRDLLLRNRIAPSGATADETVQQATVAVRQSASGDYLVRDRNGAQRYEQVLVGLEVDSQRFHQGGARIELDAACLGGCPAGVEPRVDAVASTLDARDVRREGRGVAYFAIDPRALPVGVTTLVLGASYEAGHGGTIAQHVVRLVQRIGVAADPRDRSLPTAASWSDRNGRGSARGAVKATDAAYAPRRLPTAATGPPPTTATCRSSRSRRRGARPSCRRRRPGAAPPGRGANPLRRSSRPRRRPRRAR
jgi:hypothetical protein